ncbi:hypothetical protein [Maribellus maritimus]|uniref:hypothetical protein n=1 Tax=Maribellus maritimus TaxID=2870838 RepID=UPI001EEB5039|nr:hypothetical protein [Maribellus maritimus]MCG6188710.1 hypothetical protein [Maribellus maritimus]
MKTIKTLILFLVFVSLFACSKDDNEDFDVDFSVLGITSVTVNGQQFNISNNTMLDIEGNDTIVVTGTQTTMSVKHMQIDYAVQTNSTATFSVNVKSDYPDVSVVTSEETNNNFKSVVVVIYRTGYDEQLTYKFTPFTL